MIYKDSFSDILSYSQIVSGGEGTIIKGLKSEGNIFRIITCVSEFCIFLDLDETQLDYFIFHDWSNWYGGYHYWLVKYISIIETIENGQHMFTSNISFTFFVLLRVTYMSLRYKIRDQRVCLTLAIEIFGKYSYQQYE